MPQKYEKQCEEYCAIAQEERINVARKRCRVQSAPKHNYIL